MTVPDYQSMMAPLLAVLADGGERRWADVKDIAATKLAVTDVEREELLPSGRQSTFDNRIGWAATYLSQAGLIERPARGVLRITARGLETLSSAGGAIDNAYLRRFPEFLEFKSRTHVSASPTAGNADTDEQTPEDLIEAGYLALRSDLTQQLRDRVAHVSPRFFEQLVVRLLVKMGYGGSLADAGQAVGRSGDDGVDGIIKEDKLGLDVVYLQAKRWTNTVGRPEIQAFAGSLMGQGASKGVFITTSRFSSEARDYVRRIDKRIVLIDGELLAELMIDHGVGVSEAATYVVNRLDEDFFAEE
jgi:restriction system protein